MRHKARKIDMQGLIRGEKGQALILALILLAVGGLIIAPLLSYMGTGLITGEVYEAKTDELYAADAGVEDAVWRIPNIGLCPNQSTNYTIPDVNDKSVAITIAFVNNTTGTLTYEITSTATTTSTGGSTTIESYVRYFPGSEGDIFSNPIFNGALATQGSITYDASCTVNGDIYHCGAFNPSKLNGNWTDQGCPDPDDWDWPSAQEIENLRSSLEEQARAGGTSGTMDIKSSRDLEPIYINGDLNIGGKDVVINLTGVVYVTGKITVAAGTTFTGSGSLVAEGIIKFNAGTIYAVTGDDSIIMSLSTSNTAITFMAGGESVETLIYAPNGGIKVMAAGTINGGVVAKTKIDIDAGSTFDAESNTYVPAEESSLEIETYSVNP
jgi:hypothetical protein